MALCTDWTTPNSWRGVSSKSCKGTYKPLLNALRAARSGAMLTAEDLTAQPGLTLQQGAVLAAFLGVPQRAQRPRQRRAPGLERP